MKILYYLFVVIEIILSIYLLLPVVLLLAHYLIKAVTGNKSILDKAPKVAHDFNFAAIVTAHKDARFILPLVDSLIRQTYSNVTIYVVADGCDISGLHFNNKNVVLLKPAVDLNAKTKSIKYAVDNFVQPHDVMVIFDSDNLVHPDYFFVLNRYFRQGYRAVQTHMLSKNTESVYARLDSIGHVYNTFIERQVRMEMNLSACILGLGIALETSLYKEIIYNSALGGFDKKLQADLVKKIPLLAFAKEAIVYDEKVDDGDTLEVQRTRWLFTYFKYFKVNAGILLTGLKRFNFNLIYFGFTLLRPPLFITIALALVFTFINFFINPLYSLIWIAILFIFALNFILVIATQSRQKGMLQSIVHVPKMLLRQVKSLLKIKNANKSFLKTEHHNVIYIDDLLNIK